MHRILKTEISVFTESNVHTASKCFYTYLASSWTTRVETCCFH